MTLVTERPIEQIDRPIPKPTATAATLGWSTWRLASRLARREVRRRPGRTALVAALVAVPIMAMTAAVTVARTLADSPQERFERTAGQADLYVQRYDSRADRGDVVLPTGSREVVMWTSGGPLTLPGGARTTYMPFWIIPLEDPLVAGIVDVTDGRAPGAANEVLLDEKAAGQLRVDVGDSFELERPSGTWTVVGIGRLTDYFDGPLFVVAEFPESRLASNVGSRLSLIDLPDGLSDAELLGLQRNDESWSSRLAPRLSEQIPNANADAFSSYDRQDEVTAEQLAWGWVAGALALAVVGIIAASAFASSARRQLATIGQLSANGAPERLVRRTLALQGAWTGLIGSVAGITVALVALPFSRPLLELLYSRSSGPLQFDATSVVVIGLTGVAAATIAAMMPARSASRIPVLSALAGRRPLGATPRRLVPIGIVSFVGGIGLLVLVTLASTADDGGGSSNGNFFAAAAVLGGLAVLAGLCCASPIAVDFVGRAGARLSGTWRLAARSVARSRTRNAGVLTAIAVTGTAAIAITTAVGSLAFGNENATPQLPRDTVVLSAIGYSLPPGATLDDPVVPVVTVVPVDGDLRARVQEVVPGADIVIRRYAVTNWDTDTRLAVPEGWPPVLLVADPTTRDLLGLSARDSATLDQVGVLDAQVFSAAGSNEPPLLEYTIAVATPSVVMDLDVAYPQDRLLSRAGYWGLVVTEAKAAELGLEVVEAGIVLRTPNALTRGQLDALDEIQQDMWQESGLADAFVEPGDPTVEPTVNSVSVDRQMIFESPSTEFPRALLDLVAVVAALLLTLLVVAIGLSLAATESRDERDVLVAVGAKPRTMRQLAGTKAVVLTFGAALLAIPTGFLPVAAVLNAAPDDNAISFPWLTALGLLIVVPIVAGLAALATSALAQRLRPVRMSTLTED
jgi:putative ABC transport system permease protein